jgi:hypothetical protein
MIINDILNPSAMIFNFLKLGGKRMIIPMLLLTLQLLHFAAPLKALVGQTYCVAMYVIAVLCLTLIEIAILEGLVKRISRFHKVLLTLIYIVTLLIGLMANLYAYYTEQSALRHGMAQNALGYIDIALISLVFEGIQKVILVIRSKPNKTRNI